MATNPAISGEAGAGMRSFCSTVSKWTPRIPAPTQTAPISACEELDVRRTW
ncbi:hypothetical protein AB0H88_04670 [Nonomuraea sp. NPDC050680]|uniref:hypothetical protein n=1 Tax=Nonomuraea sp. NPDC050680 TaxID=3154630 RepID=UPI00340CE22A